MIALAILALTGPLLGVAVAAEREIHNDFTQCAGRYTAEIESAWLHHQGDAAALQARRSVFVSLTEAAMPIGGGPDALHHRLTARFQQAHLLNLAHFHTDPRRARLALRAARAHIQACEALLLDS